MPIPLFWSDRHLDHAPALQLVDGRTYPHPEKPSRPRIIREALVAAGLVELSDPAAYPDAAVDAVHAADYRAFLTEECSRIPAGQQLTPSGVSYDQSVLGSTQPEVRASYFAFGTDAPLMRATYAAARSAVDAALSGAACVGAGAAAAIALCRPPGHHAERSRMGGFCYLNNAAIAAHALSSRGRVALLDIDYHHGNGSQHLTYERADILYVSLHADPSYAYPGFSGRTEERGAGPGEGFNHNFPLPPGTAIQGYMAVLDRACERISEFEPAYLVVSLGFDTHVDDPIAELGLRSGDFALVGERVAALRIPALHVLEGGYALHRLGESSVAYFGALG